MSTQGLLVCQEAAQPVLEAIARLEQNMDAIEAAIADMDLDSKQLLQQMGLV